MAVQHIGVEFSGTLSDVADRRKVGSADIPRHGNPGQAERERWSEVDERLVGALAAGRGIGNDADPVSTGRLAAREIADVAEQSTDWRTEHMKDVEGVRHRPFTLG
jgi:hypothetical protein